MIVSSGLGVAGNGDGVTGLSYIKTDRPFMESFGVFYEKHVFPLQLENI